jgi:hypothetical protein
MKHPVAAREEAMASEIPLPFGNVVEASLPPAARSKQDTQKGEQQCLV